MTQKRDSRPARAARTTSEPRLDGLRFTTSMTSVTRTVQHDPHNYADVHVRVPAGVQRKVTVGAVNDPTEQEAEAVAQRVMALSDVEALGVAKDGVATARRTMDFQAVQRDTQPRGGDFDGTEDVSGVVHEALGAGSGRTLDAPTREFMERRFGYDFSQVRVHAGSVAARSATALHSHAYTLGTDIVFAGGQYAPETSAGRRLLAHELTHVIQQGGASPLEAALEPPPAPTTMEGSTGAQAEGGVDGVPGSA